MRGPATPHDRIAIVGDIHGCDAALDTLLDRLELTQSDILVVLGDAIDRGPGSRQVLDSLCQIEADCRLIYIRGNHEEMLMGAIGGVGSSFWLRHGGAETLDSYGGALGRIPDSHLDLLSRTIPYWETSSLICVHANLEPGIELADQQPEWLRWKALTGLEFQHPSGRPVICGHTGQPSGLPVVFDGWICLDTLAYAGNPLTCLEFQSKVVMQASQSGDFRQFPLEALMI